MATESDYIALLNDIRLQEIRAGIFLKAWADKTDNPDLKHCLSMVAEREDSHGAIFERRIRELGGPLQDNEDPMSAETLRVASSDMTDTEKNRLDDGGPTPCPKTHSPGTLRRGDGG